MSDVSRNWKLSVAHQQFSLPETLIYYMTKNPPSSKLYNKLIKCCKYFWLKNPVFTLKWMVHYRRLIWQTDEINGFPVRWHSFQTEDMHEKLWINERLAIIDENKSLASSVIPRIYRCDLLDLDLSFQTLSFDEFQVFNSSGSIEKLCLHRTLVKTGDGNVVPIEKFIELLPNLQEFEYRNVTTEDGLHSITSETAANLVAIPHFPRLITFNIYAIPESFNIEAFFAVPKVSFNFMLIQFLFNWKYLF